MWTGLVKADASHFLTSLFEAGLQQHITGPTHQHGHTLDFLISRPDDGLIVESGVSNILNSDHFIVDCSINFSKPDSKMITSNSRNYRSITETFAIDLEIAFQSFPYESSLDLQVSFYNMTIIFCS